MGILDEQLLYETFLVTFIMNNILRDCLCENIDFKRFTFFKHVKTERIFARIVDFLCASPPKYSRASNNTKFHG